MHIFQMSIEKLLEKSLKNQQKVEWLQLHSWHVHFPTLSKILPNSINQYSEAKTLDANLKFIEPKFNFTLALVSFEIFLYFNAWMLSWLTRQKWLSVQLT